MHCAEELQWGNGKALYTGELGHVLFTLGTKMAERRLFKHRPPPILFLRLTMYVGLSLCSAIFVPNREQYMSSLSRIESSDEQLLKCTFCYTLKIETHVMLYR